MKVRHQETSYGKEQAYGGKDLWPSARAGRRADDGGGSPAARDQRTVVQSRNSKYGGEGPPDAARLKGLEDENRRRKTLLAESMLDNAAPKDLLSKIRERLQRGEMLRPS